VNRSITNEGVVNRIEKLHLYQHRTAKRYIKAHLSIHFCELDRKVIGVNDSEIYKSRSMPHVNQSTHSLYRDVHIYLEPVIQDIEALGHGWRLKNR
jgi:hypothetical protein